MLPRQLHCVPKNAVRRETAAASMPQRLAMITALPLLLPLLPVVALMWLAYWLTPEQAGAVQPRDSGGRSKERNGVMGRAANIVAPQPSDTTHQMA